MFEAFRPLSLRIYTVPRDPYDCSVETLAAAPAEALPIPAPADATFAPALEAREAVTQPERRVKSALKERVQAGSAGFDFEALIQGVSTLASSPSLTSAINPKDGVELVWIPAGEFLMGSNEGERREQPVHRVFLDGFWMYKTPVTVGQYRKFYTEVGRALRHPPPRGLHDEQPVVHMSWEYARAYAQWANAALPTEAQWEKAARGTDERQYPWGNTWDEKKCHHSVGRRQNGIACVGSNTQGASPYGVLDLAGNVWEWVADWFEETYYASSPPGNPTGPPVGTQRVLRGGGWGNNSPHDFRVTTRTVGAPTLCSDSIGFRCVVPAEILSPP